MATKGGSEKSVAENALAEMLKWKPFPIPDPVPFPDWFGEILDRADMVKLTLNSLEFQKTMLQNQTKMIDQTMQILSGYQKKK